MSNSITGIPTTRVSSQFIRTQLQSQLNSAQRTMFDLETQISTGHQFQLPSENPNAALQVIGIQSLLQRKDQAQSSITTNQTYLSQTDSALSSISSLITSVRSAALSAVSATSSAAQRQAAIQQVDQANQQLVTIGNQQVNGRYLFGGSASGAPPFAIDASGNVVYSGKNDQILSYVDVNQLFATNVNGDQAFGALSKPVQGASLSPALSLDTQLSNLNGGQGVAGGTIAISDGTSTSLVDLRQAHTLGDVATLIHQHPPTGRTINAEVTSTGLTLRLVPIGGNTSDNLTVNDVNGNTTASDLGINSKVGVGPGPLVGNPLTTSVAPTTALSDLYGTKARAFVRVSATASDIILEANSPGTTAAGGVLLNGVTVQFAADAAAAGQETATFTAGTPASGNNPGAAGTLTVHISTSAASASRSDQIIAAINKVPGLPFTARLDPTAQDGSGQPPITTLPATTTTQGGIGTTLDTTSGFQIISAGKSYNVDISGDKTVQDLLNSINTSGAGLQADINPDQSGIQVRSRVSGADFSIGENGGTTATQLGLRTLTATTPLAQFNRGRGVGRNTGTPGGADFSISETVPNSATPITLSVGITTANTVGDVLTSINQAAQAAGTTIQARLTASGNGIEVYDADPTHGPITITADTQSSAAVDLGLVPSGKTSASSTAAALASGRESSGPNSGLLIQAKTPGSAGNVQVIFRQDAAIGQGNATSQYDATLGTLTIRISPSTTAAAIVTAVQGDPASNAAFSAALDTSSDPANNGSGIVQTQTVRIFGGKDVATAGTDTNPHQTESFFTSLSRLGTALKNNDNVAAQQAMGLLDSNVQNLNDVRAELGIREQSLSAISTQITAEETQLKAAVSTNYDTDMAKTISDYTSAQISYQAALQTTGSLLKLTLLNFI